ncbi:hypothetical protein EDD63_1621 [Breznakia blatticola]|uniref:Uncharacterized protein n=1 Tax=Breznakia blatticola TaxID=1754012 RepID=A0A4R7ZFG0_9FIRM|nr:hypothetical protein [Breznakia blatticola]TDW09188.1 hypothetical protein EDD63_1621 [Breznakia blatticola]
MGEIKVNKKKLQAISELEKSFKLNIQEEHDDLIELCTQMSNDEQFTAGCVEGFIELFNILIKYEEQLIVAFPELFKSFTTYDSELSNLLKKKIHTDLDGK